MSESRITQIDADFLLLGFVACLNRGLAQITQIDADFKKLTSIHLRNRMTLAGGITVSELRIVRITRIYADFLLLGVWLSESRIYAHYAKSTV